MSTQVLVKLLNSFKSIYHDAQASECQILLSPLSLCTDEGLNTRFMIHFLVYIDSSGDTFF